MKSLIAFVFAGSMFGQSIFPAIAPGGLTYFNPTILNPNAFSYQQADFDPVHNQVLFYPYGSPTGTPAANSGELLVYKPASGGFSDPANWVEVDLTSPSVGLSPYAWNFGGGFTDGSGPTTSIAGANPGYAYLPAGPRNSIPGGASRTQQGNVTVQVNLANLASDPQNLHGQTYRYIDLSTIPAITALGGFSGVWANGSAYYCPSLNNSNGNSNTVLIRYNSGLGMFNDPAAWQSFDLSTIPVAQGTGPADPELGGMQSAAYVAPNVYLIPFLNGNELSVGTSNPTLKTASKVVVFDTADSFQSGGSYQTFDLSTLSSISPTLFPGGISSKFSGFTGGVVVNGGTKLILVPWGSRDLKISSSVAVEYDSTKALNDPAAWTYIDLTTVDKKAAGYQYGWLDKDGFVWLVPTHNYQATSAPANPPFAVYNTALPFNQAASWTTYPNNGPGGRAVWLTGAAYDPNTNTAWMSAYGIPPTSTTTEVSYNLELQESGTSTATVAPNGVVNAASYTSPVAPGSIASGFGNFLLAFPSGDTTLPVPTSLTGLSLNFAGGVLAPLFFVSEGQVNFQVPWELAGQSQTTLSALLIGENSAVGQGVDLAPFAPGIFSASSSGTGQGDIFDLSYRLVDASNPAAPGSYVTLYCTGLGAVTNQPPTGSPAPVAPLAQTTALPNVTIGGAQATVQFSGLAPGFAGLYQVNVQVPPGSATGSAVPVVLSIGGVASNTVTMAVQ